MHAAQGARVLRDGSVSARPMGRYFLPSEAALSGKNSRFSSHKAQVGDIDADTHSCNRLETGGFA